MTDLRRLVLVEGVDGHGRVAHIGVGIDAYGRVAITTPPASEPAQPQPKGILDEPGLDAVAPNDINEFLATIRRLDAEAEYDAWMGHC